MLGMEVEGTTSSELATPLSAVELAGRASASDHDCSLHSLSPGIRRPRGTSERRTRGSRTLSMADSSPSALSTRDDSSVAAVSHIAQASARSLEDEPALPPRTLRVSQLDSADLDDALVGMLGSRLAESLDNFGVNAGLFMG